MGIEGLEETEGGDQKSEVRGLRSEGVGQRAEVRKRQNSKIRDRKGNGKPYIRDSGRFCCLDQNIDYWRS